MSKKNINNKISTQRKKKHIQTNKYKKNAKSKKNRNKFNHHNKTNKTITKFLTYSSACSRFVFGSEMRRSAFGVSTSDSVNHCFHEIEIDIFDCLHLFCFGDLQGVFDIVWTVFLFFVLFVFGCFDQKKSKKNKKTVCPGSFCFCWVFASMLLA